MVVRRVRFRAITITLAIAPLLIAVATPAAAAAPSNDDFDQATVVGTLPFTQTQSTLEATSAPDDPSPSCAFGSATNTVWYAFTPAENSRLVADTFGSDYDTNLSVWQGSRGALSQVACSEDAGSGLQSKVQFDAVSGTTYHFMAAGSFDEGGALTFSLGIARVATKLGLAVSKTLVFAGEAVKVTVHLDAFQDATNREVQIYGTPRGGTKKLVAQGTIDSAGNFSTSPTLNATTTFVAEWSGDERYLPATSNRKLVYFGVDPGDWFGPTSQAYTIEFIVKDGTYLTRLEVSYRIKLGGCGVGEFDTTVKLSPPVPIRNGRFVVTWKLRQISAGEVTGLFKSRRSASGTLRSSFRDPRSGCHGDTGAVRWNATAF